MSIKSKIRPVFILFVSVIISCFFTLTASLALAISPPPDVDYGSVMDEQQGGGGLAAEIIRILNGNNIQSREDLRFASPNRLGLIFKATYNSQSNILGSLGYGWAHTYKSSLDPSFGIEGVTYIKIIDNTGRSSYFLEETLGLYKGAFKELTHVKAEEGGYVWYRLDGSRLCFSSSGRLTWIEDEKGNRLELAYSDNKLQTVTDTSSSRMLTFNYNGNGKLESISGPITDAVPSGIWVTYSYDTNQNLTSVTYADGSGFNYAYTDPNDVHNLTEKKDKLNHLLSTWSYDNQDRVINNFSAKGKGVSISYVSAIQVDVTDAYGTIRTYTLGDIDGRKRVTAMSGTAGAPYSDGNATRWVYDDSMRLSEVEYSGGTINQYQDYDDWGNPQTVKLSVGTPEEKVTTYTYHPEMNVAINRIEASILGGGNKVTIWDFDNDYDATPNEEPTRLLSRIIEKGFTKDTSGGVIPYEYITTFIYNSKGQILSIDGPLPGSDDITSFTYDTTTGNLLGITRPLIGSTSLSEYDGAGMLGKVTDVNAQSKSFSYDGRVRITAIINNADGSSTTFTYNIAGQPESLTDPDGITRGFSYDTVYGRFIRITDPEGNYIAYGYDAQGNRIEMSYHDPLDSRTFWKRYTYQQPDIPGKLWKVINSDDTYTEHGYDSAGNTALKTDHLGNATTYNYDPLNRLIMVIQPGNVTSSYSYNIQDKLSGVTDPEGHETTYIYDDMGRLLSTTSPDTGTVTFVYNEAGNLIQKTDAKGTTVTYTYDPLNRLLASHFSDPSQDITHSYGQGTNGKGRLTGITDPSGNMAYEYDALGRIAHEIRTVDERDFTIEYIYSAAARLTGIIYPTGRTVTYSRNILGKISGVSTTYNGNTKTLVNNLTYLPFGPAKGMDMGTGSAVNNLFDELYRMTVANPGAEKERIYEYDANGNITSINVTNNMDKNQTFTYDPLNRLTEATGIYGPISYTYDKVGNRLTKTMDDQTETYNYITGTNKLQEITGPNPVTFTYDQNGNTTAIGNKSLIYNQNNRLIHSEENGTTLGEYTYNGLGQRVKKVTEGQTILFIYDKDGNIITEADDKGNILREYVYLNGKILAQFTYEIPEEIEVNVTTSKGRELFGINVYAFTESGSYTGIHSVTNDQGVALFSPEDFTDGNYKFRADYLSYQFWSPVINIPGTYSTQVLIEEESAEVTVTVAGEEKEGINVYLFNENGSYLGLYQVTDTEGKVSFDLPVGKSFTFRADHMGSQYWSHATVIEAGGTTYVDVDTGGGILTVTVRKDVDQPLIGINVYLFSPSGSYLGHYDTTNENGQASFTVSEGNYKVRADYLGYQFWSDIISVNENTSSILTISHQDVIITVEGDYDGDIKPRENLNIYLFTPSGSYLSQYQVTNDQGQVTFNLPEKDYKVRADYLSQQYFSEVFNWTNETITINEGIAEVTVTNMGLPIEDVNVYVFNNSGSYLGIYDVTDINGNAFFRLPQGDYNFRGDYMGSQYWSGVSTIIAHVENPVNISTGGGSFTLTVLKAEEDPLIGVNCYLFSESGSYLGEHGLTNDQGEVGFNLADGTYKIRVNYLGYQFWTEVFSVPDTSSLTYTIAHQDVTVTVEGDYDGDIEKRENLNVYLFTPSGSYLSQYQVTNDLGQVIFSLPEKDYKVRADYLSGQYFSDIFNWTDTTITINEGIAEIHMLQGSTPLENVNIYVFTSSDSYLGIYGQTNEDGVVNFRLPEGTYKFRGDYQGSQYWATEPVNAHQVNIINLNTGGGTFTLTVEKEAGSPLVNIPVYVFTSGGRYLGISAHTDDQGKVSFDLSDGDYKFRADYLGYQFWSDVATIPTTLSDTLTIPHQDVTITVNEVYGAESDPLEGINVYLFTASGSYMSQYQVTNAQGQVTFNLPQEDYKVRADYLSGQYFSDVFNWMDTEVDIDHGLIDLHVTFNGEDVYYASVYLFTESGRYLGRYERTDEYGHAVFLIPSRSYKFRVDYEGTQYWSGVVNVIAHEETDVELPLEQIALNLTNDPDPVRFDGKPPVFRPGELKVASIGSLVGILAQTVVANTSSPKVYNYLNNYLGTPQIMTDENGVVVWEATYKPFGEADVNPYSNIVNNFRLPGQYLDQETGLHYNYFRDYHPGVGRYIEADPIGLRGGINMYAYCMNDPVNLVDPSGQFIINIVGAAIGGASGFVSGFVAGAQAGNIWAGIAGGVAGGIVGGIVGGVGGYVFSPKVGAIVGSIVGGVIGGASAGGITKKLEDPNASTEEKLWATGKGAGIGLIIGTFGGFVSYTAIGMNTLRVGVDIGAAVITTPIACVLGVFSNLFMGRDTEGNITSTLPGDWQYDLSWLYYWNPDNPQEIDRNSSVEISVIGGFPPYTWQVSGNGFILSLNETEVPSNALYANNTACGTATITVTDNYGVLVKGYVRCTAESDWVLKGSYRSTDTGGLVGGSSCPCCGDSYKVTIGHEKYIGIGCGCFSGGDDATWTSTPSGAPASPPCGSPYNCCGSDDPGHNCHCIWQVIYYYKWECT